MKTICSLIRSPYTWIALSLVYLAIQKYYLKSPFIDIKKVFSNYRKVFPKLRDFTFFVFFPIPLSFASMAKSFITAELANTIAVVLSILTSMILTFMVMTNEKYVSNQGKPLRDLDDQRLEAQNKDAMAVGMFEIVVSCIILIAIFIFPILQASIWPLRIISFLLYYGFYVFVINIVILVRRLYQVYFPKK